MEYRYAPQPAAYAPGQAFLPPQDQYAPFQQHPPVQTGLRSKPTSTCCRRCQMCCTCCLCTLAVFMVPFAYFCHHLNTPRALWGLDLSAKYWGGRGSFNWWNLSVQRPEALLKSCQERMQDVKQYGAMNYGSLPAEEAVKMAYECTKVPGIFERVPERMRGVFWMSGNAIAEELSVLQMGEWYEEDRTLVVPYAPFMWAWPGGMNDKAPLSGALYTKLARGKTMPVLPDAHPAFAFKFEECPGGIDIDFIPFHGYEGHKCVAGSGTGKDLTFAKLQAWTGGNPTAIGHAEHYTIEELQDAASPGNAWHRGIYYSLGGVLGRCRCIDFGSYTLKRIMDGEGKPIEPYYTEFLEYQRDIPLVFWTGYADKKAKELYTADNFSAGWQRSQDLHCEQEAAGVGAGICS